MSALAGVHKQACADDGCTGCFVVPPPRSAKEPGESEDRRRTRLNRESLASGIHPATLAPLLGTDDQCGNCAHHHAYDYHNGRFHKCDLHRLGVTHSAASDVRLSWPACTRFEPEAES